MHEGALTSWQVVMTGQSPPIVDHVLMVVFFIAAITQYSAIAVSGMGAFSWRGPVAIGWSLWFVRFAWAWIVGDDPVVPPVAAVAITLIGTGAILRNINDSLCDKLRS